MSLERARALLRGERPDKMPFYLGGLDHPAHTTKVTGIDAYRYPAEAYLEYCRRLDIDLIGGIPGSSDHFAEGEVRQMQEGWSAAEWGIGATVWHNPTEFTSPDDVLHYRPLAQDFTTVYGELKHRRGIDEMAAEFGESHRVTQARVGDVALVPAGFGTTLFQYGIALFGWEPFLATAALYPAEYRALLEQFAEISIKVTTAWAQTDIEMFHSHDDLAMTRGTVFHPDWYREYIIPWYTEIWAPLKRRGIKVIFISDGDYSALVDDIMAAGADGCFSEPLVDIAMLVEKFGESKILLSGADTRLLTTGTPAEVAEDVRRKMTIGKRAKGLCFMAAGGTPQNCPLENVEALFATFSALRYPNR